MARFPVGAAAAVVWVGCLLVALVASGSGHPAGDQTGQIAFDSVNARLDDSVGEEGCPWACNVEVMNADGSGRRVVGRGFLPAWSPDGSRLAYWAPWNLKLADSSTSRLVALDLRTGKREQFLRVAEPEAAPAWSPDGSQLAFVAPHGRKPLVGLVSVKDGRFTRLASPASHSYGRYYYTSAAPSPVAWSPDGRSIVYTDASGELASVPTTGGSPSVLISNAALAAAAATVCRPGGMCSQLNPAFSPDGSMIAFNLNGDWGQNLWLANGDGSDPRHFPPTGNTGSKTGRPSWSSDGSQIAFAETGDPCGFGYPICVALSFPCSQSACAGPAIMRILVNSGTTEQLNQPTGAPGGWPMDEHPAWSPDGRWLVFDRSGIPQGGIPGEGIWRIRDDGTCLKRIAGDHGATRDSPSDPVWRPSGGSPTDACS